MHHGVGRYEHKATEAFRFLCSPFESLETTHRAAHKSAYVLKTQMVGQNGKGAGHIADSEVGKTVVVGRTGGRVYTRWACRAIA